MVAATAAAEVFILGERQRGLYLPAVTDQQGEESAAFPLNHTAIHPCKAIQGHAGGMDLEGGTSQHLKSVLMDSLLLCPRAKLMRGKQRRVHFLRSVQPDLSPSDRRPKMLW